LAARDLLLQLRPLSKGAPLADLIYDSGRNDAVNDPWFVFSARKRVPLGAVALNAVTWGRVAGLARGRSYRELQKERRLVCFDVYGHDSSRLEPASSAFDQQLERTLSLPLHHGGDYEIKPIVCREWYGDTAWDPLHTGPAEILDL
jgi:hypothetical protein